MTASSRRERLLASAAMLAMMLSAGILPMASPAAAEDEIPHENFDLVSADLDVVVLMLNSSIAYSERALMCMFNETMALAEQNLSAVRNLLGPAEELLEEIEDLASSYDDLSALLPPFTELSGLMDEFAADEATLLEIRAQLVSASELVALTGDELIAALDAIKRFNELASGMRVVVDEMLVPAEDITGTSIEGDTPFEDNRLVPLIEKLKELLSLLEDDLSRIVTEDLPLEGSEPFLLLWTSSPSYYLGDAIVGGGYLFFNGAFVSGYTVRMFLDGSPLTSAVTTAGGEFSFSFSIPLEGSWVGIHTLFANCTTPAGLLASESLPLRISLIPTVMSLSLSASAISIEESATASVSLRDFRGNPIESDGCWFDVDGETLAFGTGADGDASRTWSGTQLGYGKHSVRAFYGGEVPYAPNASAVRPLSVDIPTTLDLRLFSAEVFPGQYIVGNGTLFANDTELLAGQNISLFLDETLVMNVTTDAEGGFAFTIGSEELAAGGHALRAALLDRDDILRYSQDVEWFTIRVYEEGEYPFWPIIPGWGGVPGDLIPYLFIGKNAYFFWLLLLSFAGVTIRILQMRKRAATTAARKGSEELDSVDSSLRASGAAPGPPEGALELPPASDGPANPNERIVWHYQRLLALLMRKGWPGLRASMTHREVERVLKAWGYPRRPVEEATMLFERALYSGARMTDEDAIHMSAAMTSLVRPGGRKVVQDAV